jgi:hypothetical protein
VVDFWILQSRWWGREEKRIYFRLETDGGVVEVYRTDASFMDAAAPGRDASERSAAPVREPQTNGVSSKPQTNGVSSKPQTNGVSSKPRTIAAASKSRTNAAAEPAPSSGHPPFIEGDTHTRELRQTESPYRPDAAALADRRQGMDTGAVRPRGTGPKEAGPGGTGPRGAGRAGATRFRWVLSKVMD